jgi:hypothetical protein
MRSKLTYSNVMSTLCFFLLLSGGAAYAASQLGKNSVGSRQLKKNSVTTAKIRKNAVTSAKIKNNAVTEAKIKADAVTSAQINDGAVTFADLGTGTTLVGTATGGPIPATQNAPMQVPLDGTTTFTPQPGVAYFLSVEAKGELDHLSGKICEPTITPIVNGNIWEVAEGFLSLRSREPEPAELTGKRPVSGETGPLGLLSPGVAQSIAVTVKGSPECTAGSTVSVAIAITQAK